MQLLGLDHVTIRTSDIEGTKNFFIAVFDVMVKERPKQIQRIPGYWLYNKQLPVIHIIGSYMNTRPVYMGETIDHVGFKIQGYEEFKERLTSLGIDYSLMDLKEINERRVFFHTPTGILLEGVFDWE